MHFWRSDGRCRAPHCKSGALRDAAETIKADPGFPKFPIPFPATMEAPELPAVLPVLSNLLFPAGETEAGTRVNALGETILLPKPIRAPGAPVYLREDLYLFA